MKQDDVIRLAIKAGAAKFYPEAQSVKEENYLVGQKFLEDFAKLVAEHEREMCAKLAQKTVCDTHIPTGIKIYGTAAAKAIRARGQA